MDLNTMLFTLLAGLLSLYAILDGFDLGVGVLSLVARTQEERDIHVAAIGPFWDGNEVWLLTAGNVLFGAFPVVFATAFSGFYLGIMLVLLALVARAVAMEFRKLYPASRWYRAWDLSLGLGSLVPALLFGVVVGNVLVGLPIGPGPTWQGTFLGLLGPRALLVGLASCAFFVQHGALYLRTKTEGPLSDRMARAALGGYAAFVVLAAVAAIAIVPSSPLLLRKGGDPRLWTLALLLAVSVVAIPVATLRGRKKLAFAASSATVALAIFAMAFSLYPLLVPSSLGEELSLTIYNAASMPSTLATILAIAMGGVPFILGYTFFVYRVFRGPARVAEEEDERLAAPQDEVGLERPAAVEGGELGVGA